MQRTSHGVHIIRCSVIIIKKQCAVSWEPSCFYHPVSCPTCRYSFTPVLVSARSAARMALSTEVSHVSTPPRACSQNKEHNRLLRGIGEMSTQQCAQNGDLHQGEPCLYPSPGLQPEQTHQEALKNSKANCNCAPCLHHSKVSHVPTHPRACSHMIMLPSRIRFACPLFMFIWPRALPLHPSTQCFFQSNSPVKQDLHSIYIF